MFLFKTLLNSNVFQGRDVSWDRAFVSRKAEQTGATTLLSKNTIKKDEIVLPLNIRRQSWANGYLMQVGPADPKWDEWLNMEINVLDIPRSATVEC